MLQSCLLSGLQLLHRLLAALQLHELSELLWLCEPPPKAVLYFQQAVLKRRLPKMRTIPVRRGISTTSPSAIKNAVPLFQGSWNAVAIGSGQIDTVAQCGGSLEGEFIFSMGFVDVSVGWTEYRGQWNKTMNATKNSLEDIRSPMPYLIVMVHPDCGKEFLNTEVIAMIRYAADEHSIEVTRSRAYHKNDNGHIEQRNDHVARKWLTCIIF